MDRDVLTAIRDLLSSSRVLALAAIVDGEPEAALLPFAVRADYRAIYVQASALARHARALTTGATVGVLVHVPDSEAADPMQLARLTVRAEVRTLDRESDEYADAAARFIERFPGAKMTLNLGDFALHELTLGRGRYVEGFARAFNVGLETFKELDQNPRTDKD
jgi:putative heme iron utilization protein